ncbi:MAG: sensor histidine kinase [Planctomycetota bacterium]|nr:MAG: sensor histidine kinase [Planctomycetota bacterium]
MNRPFYIWLIFGLCAVVVLATVGWISLTVIRLDQAQWEAQIRAAFEEDIRLALWRMDSALAPLIAQESARPYFSYSAFYPADRAYAQMYTDTLPSELLLPSPLLTFSSPQILLHFQIGPEGLISSPQIPTGKMSDLVQADQNIQKRIPTLTGMLTELQGKLDKNELAAQLPEPEPQPINVVQMPELQKAMPPQRQVSNSLRNDLKQQMEFNKMEWQARKRSQTSNTIYFTSNTRVPYIASEINTALMKPLWIDDVLLLARLVKVDQKQYIQGCWLNWPALRQWLINNIRDLLPQADLKPSPINNNGQERRLAALPVSLIPGTIAVEPMARISPIRYSLIIAWLCVLLAAIAVAVLLMGAISLSERRGAFVSAVTHELRTPLTTFCLYTDMLAEGKVQDPEKQKRYLNTLRTESGRLGYLVENVLAYARLEGNRARHHRESIKVQDLVDRVEERLSERARQAEMILTVEATDDVRSVKVGADISSVEQILLNLVDNACKYAASATNRNIRLKACRKGNIVILQIADYGPGIPRADARKIFKPFHKSADESANTAPGVGLGLALSIRLARNMGGNLCLNDDTKDGACFELSLPIA